MVEEIEVYSRDEIRKKSKLDKRILFGIFVIIILIAIFYYTTCFNESTNVITGISKLTGNNVQEIVVSSNEENICYWITPTFDKAHFIEIKKYESPNNDCYGNLIEKERIVVDGPVNIRGVTDCICFEKILLKITKNDNNIILEARKV